MNTNINIKILPFGSISMEIHGEKGGETPLEREQPVYVMPKTTSSQRTTIFLSQEELDPNPESNSFNVCKGIY